PALAAQAIMMDSILDSEPDTQDGRSETDQEPAATDVPPSRAPRGPDASPPDASKQGLVGLLQTEAAQNWLRKLSAYGVTEHDVRAVLAKTADGIGALVLPKAYDLVGLGIRLLIDTLLLVIALYFYFADGPHMLRTLDELTPLPP